VWSASITPADGVTAAQRLAARKPVRLEFVASPQVERSKRQGSTVMAALAPGIVLAAVLMAPTLAGADPAPAAAGEPRRLSPEAAAAVVPLHEAYLRLEQAQAKLPPPRSRRERLERLVAVEDAGDAAFAALEIAGLPPDQAELALGYARAELATHVAADQAALKSMTPAHGWFTISGYGARAAEAALMLVVASDDMDWKKDVLARIEPLLKAGEVSPQLYAVLYDSVALAEGRPQRYGTYVRCLRKGYAATGVEDAANLDRRRKEIGLRVEAEYLKAVRPPCAAEGPRRGPHRRARAS
jgi:hypothetical protein